MCDYCRFAQTLTTAREARTSGAFAQLFTDVELLLQLCTTPIWREALYGVRPYRDSHVA